MIHTVQKWFCGASPVLIPILDTGMPNEMDLIQGYMNFHPKWIILIQGDFDSDSRMDWFKDQLIWIQEGFDFDSRMDWIEDQLI